MRHSQFFLNEKASFSLTAFLCFFALGIVPTGDPDLWWHLASGRYILERGLPAGDVFSFTASGKPWIVHEWLTDAVFWSLYRCGELPSLVVLSGILSAVCFGFLYFAMSCRTPLAAYGALAAAGLSRLIWGAGTRPQLITLCFLAFFVWVLERVRAGALRARWFFLCPVAMLFWANSHAGYPAGIVFLSVYAAGDLLEGAVKKDHDGVMQPAAIRTLGLAIAGCILASLANPYGPRIWSVPFSTLSNPVVRRYIQEWLPFNFRSSECLFFFLIALFGAAGFVVRRNKPGISESIIFLSSALAGFLSQRHIPFFAVMSVPIIVRNMPWARRNGGLRSPEHGMPRRSLNDLNPLLVHWIVFALCLLGSLVWTGFTIKKNEQAMTEKLPVKAVDFIKDHRLEDRRFFNVYEWGCYLMWRKVPVFIDGRAELLYTDRFLEKFTEAYFSSGSAALAVLASEYRIGGLLLKHDSPQSRMIRARPGWRLLYEDSLADVYIFSG